MTTTVLVAESDEGQAKVLSQALSQRGWQVLQARDTVATTAAMLRHRPGAVVLSQKLPGGGGLLALRRLRASVHTAMTPVIAIVGSRPEDQVELRLHGADECVSSPVDAAAIADWIQKRLGAPVIVTNAPASIIGDSARLASLAQTGLLDSSPSESFDALTRCAASMLGVPVALVSLVDSGRQFFKSQFGLPDPWATTRETPLTHSFCQWVVADHMELVIADAREHPVLRQNGALHDLGVIAYAGSPITAASGSPIGSFCAIDTKPHAWSREDTTLLEEFARVTEALIALSEFSASDAALEQGADAKNIRQSATTRAVGDGIARIAKMLSRGDPRLGEVERNALVNVVQWLGQQLVRVGSC